MDPSFTLGGKGRYSKRWAIMPGRHSQMIGNLFIGAPCKNL